MLLWDWSREIFSFRGTDKRTLPSRAQTGRQCLLLLALPPHRVTPAQRGRKPAQCWSPPCRLRSAGLSQLAWTCGDPRLVATGFSTAPCQGGPCSWGQDLWAGGPPRVVLKKQPSAAGRPGRCSLRPGGVAGGHLARGASSAGPNLYPRKQRQVPSVGDQTPRRGFAGIAAAGNTQAGGKTLCRGWGSSG